MTCLFTDHRVAVAHGLEAALDSYLPGKVRRAGFRADPGAGEEDDVAAPADLLGELLKRHAGLASAGA